MEPMFLPEVERRAGDDSYSKMIAMARAAGREYPQIWHLFAYKRRATEHLERFTHEVMRGPSPLSPGQRELIAALVSARNQCLF